MYQYVITPHFERQLKHLRRHFAHIAADTTMALILFDKRTSTGLGHGIYKLRMRSSDLTAGKSHAFRMIILVIEKDNLISPVIIYFKGHQASARQTDIVKQSKIVMAQIQQLTR